MENPTYIDPLPPAPDFDLRPETFDVEAKEFTKALPPFGEQTNAAVDFIQVVAAQVIQIIADSPNAAALAFNLQAAEGASLVHAIQSGAGAVERTVLEELRDVVKIQQFGGVADGDGAGGGTSNTVAFARAVAHAHALDRPVCIDFGRGVYRIDAVPAWLNPARVMLSGDSATLDFTNVPGSAGTALWWRGVGTAGESPISNSARPHIRGLKLVGNKNIRCCDVFSDSGTQDSRQTTFTHVVFKGFAEGIRLSKNGWKLALSNYAFEDCDIHINELMDDSGTGFVNFGENNTATNGMHSGAGLAYKSRNGNSDMHFVGVSFDTPAAVDIAHGARVFASHCHIEPGADTSTLFKVEGDASGLAQTLLVVRDSLMVLTGSTRNNKIFSNAEVFPTGNGGIHIDQLAIQSACLNYVPRALVSGPGRTSVRGLRCAYEFPAGMYASPALNRLAQGGMEVATFAETDFAPVDGSFPPTIDTVAPHSGAKSMKMLANGTAFIGGKLQRPMRPGQTAFLSYWFKHASVGGGAFFVLIVHYLDGKGGVLSVVENRVLTGTVAWTEFSSPALLHSPAPIGTESIYVEVVLRSGNGTGTAWLDDVILNVID